MGDGTASEAPSTGSDGQQSDASERRTGRGLTHIDGTGHARMVDVTRKAFTRRRAVARCRVSSTGAAIEALVGQVAPDGQRVWPQLVTAARIAGMSAAKQTGALIPLCHPLTVAEVDVQVTMGPGGIEIEAATEVVGQTGVEMEALAACTFAALTVLERLRSLDPEVRIDGLGVWAKSGGRSGTWLRT